VASLAAAGTLAVAPVRAQTEPPPEHDTFWIGAGLGGGSEGFAGSLNGSYQFGVNLISMRMTATAGIFEDEFYDLAILYGRATPPAGARHHLSAAVGLGLVDGCRDASVFSNCRAVSTVVGLPLELQAFWRPGKVVGLGLYGFANFNRAQSFVGVTLGLQVGRLH
jgi:hypothetical protein